MRYLTVTDSDIIESVGFTITELRHAGGSFGTLAVVFKSSPKDVYEYENVFVDTFVKLISAESIGKAFHEVFRNTKYPFRKSLR